MSARLYKVALGQDGAPARTVHVMSDTDVQAGDAAAPLMTAGEAILSIEEIEDDGSIQIDAPPPKTQAAELAPVTPGTAAAPNAPEPPRPGQSAVAASGVQPQASIITLNRWVLGK